MNGVEVIAAAIGETASVTLDAQTTKALSIITLMGCTCQLSESWAKQWAELSHTYYIDSLNVITDPSASATAAADYANYEEAIQQAQNETGVQNNILQTGKSEVTTLGNAMDEVYNVMQGPMEFVEATTKQILMMKM